MAPPRKQRVLNIYPQTTPSPNDPPGADKFYLALGVATMAWGRLENNFVACLMIVMQITKDGHSSRKHPMKWERQAIIWKDAFARIPSLKSHEKDAAAFLAEFGNMSEDRNLLIHGFWEDFHPRPPLTVNLLHIKALSGTADGIGIRRVPIRIDQLEQFAGKANKLNMEITKLGQTLSLLQGPPLPDAQIL
jgi:hypothetical protein